MKFYLGVLVPAFNPISFSPIHAQAYNYSDNSASVRLCFLYYHPVNSFFLPRQLSEHPPVNGSQILVPRFSFKAVFNTSFNFP